MQVRLSEDRVYVAGIRVHPPISDFNQELNRDFEIKQVVGEELMFECRLLERELALRGVQFDAIRLRTLEMVRNVTRFSEAGFTDDGLWVELAEGDRLEIALPDPTDGEVYFSLQPSMSSAEDAYFSWLTRLHLGVGGQFVLFASGITQSMSLSNNMAAAIHSFLAENRASDQSGSPLIWPPEIEALSPTLREQIRRPLRVPRL
ncbi:MAG: hypothetical protein DRR42_27885 [Gammaproteobacteria bacterium]|nr:MAG: hypothetical protein DRR42_27885 [Gammaproteobacteria bacterium]